MLSSRSSMLRYERNYIMECIIQIQRSFNLQKFYILHIWFYLSISLFTCVSVFHIYLKLFITIKHLNWFFSRHTTNLQQAAFPRVSCWKRTWWGSYCGQRNGLALTKFHETSFFTMHIARTSTSWIHFFLFFLHFQLFFFVLYLCKHYVTVFQEYTIFFYCFTLDFKWSISVWNNCRNFVAIVCHLICRAGSNELRVVTKCEEILLQFLIIE